MGKKFLHVARWFSISYSDILLNYGPQKLQYCKKFL